MKIPQWMIEFTGHAMLHKYPPWFMYRPDIHRVRGSDVRWVMESLRVGDIHLRRFDGYLNTILTPGFWGHAGIYVGRNQVVHAVSEGVILEDILNFCRTDAVCVLTPLTTWDEVLIAVDRARAAADENILYDFDFSSNNEKQYCTEMVDIAYSNLFNEDYVEKMGQLILMPDGIRNSKKVFLKLEIKPTTEGGTS